MMERLFRRLPLLAATLCLPAFSVQATEPRAVYDELRAARPQGQALAVKGLTLIRDVFLFRFDSGSFQFLTQVEGRTVGAVFRGEGSFELAPATDIERKHLAFVTGEKTLATLSEPFESLVLLFTDGTAAEVESRGSAADGPPAGAAGLYESFFEKQRKDLKKNLQIRLLEDVLRAPAPATGVFLAYVRGKKYPAALAAVDPQGLDWLFGDVGGESAALRVFDDRAAPLWYCEASKGDVEANRLPAPQPLAHALLYAIDTTIRKNERIAGTTTIHFIPLVSGLQVLPIHLLGNLRLEEASFSLEDSGSWSPAAFLQENEREDADAAVLFPSPLPQGALRLRLVYGGEGVLWDAGDGNFIVGARQSWYPNLGTFTDLASYDLTFRFPKAYDLVSVGTRSSESVEGDTKITVWKEDRPIRVAGFNYGKFRRLERADPESGVTLDVYTRSTQGLHGMEVDLDALADAATADGINTARVGTAWFGPLPDRRISITQQRQFFFGQSWPSLIYLPSLLGVDATIRREIGLDGINALARGVPEAAEFVEEVGPHEFAHQWWGQLVGERGYRDAWLSEGFAQFTASLVLQAAGGARKFDDFWEKARRWILEKPRGSVASNDAAGPIAEGWRLWNRKNPNAYQAMVYTKGAYVLHMLRMMMREPASPEPDRKFIDMMKDFVSAYAGKNPSTRDFQAVIERHMVPALNLAGDGRMDWFFRQWVDGTEIPRYRQKLQIAKTPDGRYRITGSVSQEAVSPDFRTLVQLYLEFPKGEIAHLGSARLSGTVTIPVDATVRLPKEPRRALIDAFHDVLCRD